MRDSEQLAVGSEQERQKIKERWKEEGGK